MVEECKYNKHKSSTKKIYHHVWQKFNKFVIQLDNIPAKWEERVCLFCAYLLRIEHVQSTTMRSYVSAIKSKLVADDYPWDDNLVLLSTLTANCKNTNDEYKPRLPITRKLLEHILFELTRFNYSNYVVVMYQTAFSLAYYGLLRAGELTLSPHVIRAKNVHKASQKDKFMLVLYSSKTHGKGSKPQIIKISAADDYTQMKLDPVKWKKYKLICPFFLLQKYLSLRGGYDKEDKQLLIFKDGTPLHSGQLRRVLRKTLKKLNLNPKLYDLHSFRKGRAGDLLKKGVSIERIKRYGRWKSNAVFKYLYG